MKLLQRASGSSEPSGGTAVVVVAAGCQVMHRRCLCCTKHLHCPLPAGLVKSSSGMVTTPELVAVVGDQSMRPSNPAEPSTGDFR